VNNNSLDRVGNNLQDSCLLGCEDV